jgi:hypothetical protein
VVRYALRRREPLELEHEAFLDLLGGDRHAPVVGLREGAEIVSLAEAVLHSARAGVTVQPPAKDAVQPPAQDALQPSAKDALRRPAKGG